jgi:5,10-methylenetetrahydromethanopterin reductase
VGSHRLTPNALGGDPYRDAMEISAAFATSMDTPDHIKIAESVGYERAWVYDSPALLADARMVLALAADRTSRIGLGPAVLVPSLRHPMTNAAAIASLCAIAPGRVSVAIGSGFTGRYILGQNPMRWADVERYVRTVRALLAGETAEWEGKPIRMIQPAGFVAARPVDVTFLIGADGPKGAAVATAVGDGTFDVATPNAVIPGRAATLKMGTVLQSGEDAGSDRVLTAAGHAVAVVYHAMYERGGPDAAARLPGGAVWVAGIEAIPEDERHLFTHEGHLVELTGRDRSALDAGGADLIMSFTFTGTPEALRDKVARLAESGITEIAYQPAGPDIPGELERFHAAVA